jgi:hypothetical protein
VVGLNPVVGIPIGPMPGCRRLLQHHRVRRRPVGHDLAGRDPGRTDSSFEAPSCCHHIPPQSDEHVDDLACLIDRAVHIAPPAGHLHGGLVHEPALADGVPAGPGGLGQQWGEPLDPAGDGAVIYFHATLGEELLDIAVRQRKAEVPADRQHDHVGREKQKPAKADPAMEAGWGRRVLMATVCLLRARSPQCNSALHFGVSMSLDGLIAQPNDKAGRLHDWIFDGETDRSGTSLRAGATGSNREAINASAGWPCGAGWR